MYLDNGLPFGQSLDRSCRWCGWHGTKVEGVPHQARDVPKLPCQPMRTMTTTATNLERHHTHQCSRRRPSSKKDSVVVHEKATYSARVQCASADWELFSLLAAAPHYLHCARAETEACDGRREDWKGAVKCQTFIWQRCTHVLRTYCGQWQNRTAPDKAASAVECLSILAVSSVGSTVIDEDLRGCRKLVRPVSGLAPSALFG